jgi:hypothetical protein
MFPGGDNQPEMLFDQAKASKIVRWALAETIFFYELQVLCGERPLYV